MLRRALDLLLVVLLCVGACLLWQSTREENRLSRKYERLCRITGDLAIGDPSQAYVQAIETGEPLQFAWNTYLPPSCPLVLQSLDIDGSGSRGGMVTSAKSEQFILRVGLRLGDNGVLQVYQRFNSGSLLTTVGDEAFAKFVLAHAHELRVEQLGTNGSAKASPNQSTALLRLTIPDELFEEARRVFPARAGSLFPALLEIKLGPEPTTP